MRRIAFYLFALALAAGALACDGCGKSRPGAPARKPLPPGQTRIEPWKKSSAAQISDVSISADAISFKLTVAADAAIPSSADPFIFCVPEDGALTVTLESFSAAGAALPMQPENPAPGGPRQYASIRRLGVMRRWPLAAVKFAPDFWKRAGEAAAAAAPGKEGGAPGLEAALKIRWAKPHPTKKQRFADLAAESGWGPVMERLVANPEGLAVFGLAEPTITPGVVAGAEALGFRTGAGGAAWAKLALSEEGLFKLDLAALAKAGVADAETAPANLRAFYRGAPYPLIRRGIGSRPGVYLWNDANDSPFTKERVYWFASLPSSMEPQLAAEDLSGPVHQVLDRTWRTARFDEDNELLMALGPFREILNMQWADRPFEGNAPLAFSLALEHLAPTTETLWLEARLVVDDPGEDAPKPDLSGGKAILRGGGRALGERALDIANEMTLRFELPPDAVKAGANEFEIAIEAPQPIEGLWFDSANLRYPSQTRFIAGRMTLSETGLTTASVNLTPVSDPPGLMDTQALAFERSHQPGAPDFKPLYVSYDGKVTNIHWAGARELRVEAFDLTATPAAANFTAAAPSSLLDEDQGADYVIIAHEDFLDAAAPLAAHHAARGLRVKTVGVQQVYDEFSHGEFSPGAIRAFLGYALAHWKKGAPQYVLLAGDCTSDYRGQTRNDVRNWVPSYTMESGMNRWASDDWFGQAAGRDALSDFFIGRLSANNAADLAEIVGKEIAYAAAAPGAHRARMAYVSDTEDEFADGLDALAAQDAPPAMRAERVYQRDLPAEDNRYAPDEMREDVFAREGEWMKVTPAATQRIYEILRAGAAIMTYFGHGSPNVWSMERMWFGGDHYASDNLHLVDSGHPVFLVNLTCNSGAIDYPIPRWNVNITEDMIRTRGGGAVGAFVPTGPGLAALHRELGARLFGSIFSDGLREIGGAIAATKAHYLAAELPEELARMYLLLGDPAMRLALPETIGEFNLADAELAPGEAAKAEIVELSFAAGEFTASVMDAAGKVVSETAAARFSGSIIALEIPLPAELAPGPHRIALYARGEGSGEDLAASAAFAITKPGGEPAPAAAADGPARLRIIPESLRAEPESPTEGHTILIHAEIENAGGAESAAATLRLYDAPPGEGAAPVYNHIRRDGAPVPPLAPGERRAFAVRWDPVKNAGERDYWLRLEAAAGAGLPRAGLPEAELAGAPEDLMARGKIRVKTREKLAYGRIWAAANELDLRRRRMFLKAEVLNEGETEAKNVTVFFFLGEPGDESQVLHEALVESVPGNSKKTAIYEWDFGRDPRAAEIDGVPNFWVMIMQKASGQRIRSEAGEHSAE